MKPLSKLLPLLVLACLLEACGDSKNKKIIDELNAENSRLRRQVEQLNAELSATQSYQSAKKYTFVVLNVEQTEGYPPEVVSYTNLSSIEAVDNLTEDMEYRLLDDFQNTYLKSIKAQVNKGVVRDRKIYSFDTYAEASKAREQFSE